MPKRKSIFQPVQYSGLGGGMTPVFKPKRRQTVKRRTINDEDRRQWVLNEEGLYWWQRRSGQSMRQFIREHRQEIDKVINKVLNREPAR